MEKTPNVARYRKNDREKFSVLATGAALGADIVGLDLSANIEDEVMNAVKRAWAAHLVLRFRGQRLNDDQLMAFSRRFGDLDLVPIPSADPRRELKPGFVTVISNVIENGKAIGALGAYEASWHTDMSYQDKPPIGSALYALEVPSLGGDTWFANMYLAYERLDQDLKDRVENAICKHDATHNSAGELRRGFNDLSDPRDVPGALHPIVRTHPVTRRKALYLGRRKNAYLMGLGLEESEGLLDALWAHACGPEFVWRQQWRVGDLVLWDNRCTLHRRDAFDSDARRVMHRTQFKGEAVS